MWREPIFRVKPAICIGRVGSLRKEGEMVSLLATLVALVCFGASVALIYTADAVYVYPPRFE
jgi:hypothetical protein